MTTAKAGEIAKHDIYIIKINTVVLSFDMTASVAEYENKQKTVWAIVRRYLQERSLDLSKQQKLG